jgi:hypothetical protein
MDSQGTPQSTATATAGTQTDPTRTDPPLREATPELEPVVGDAIRGPPQLGAFGPTAQQTRYRSLRFPPVPHGGPPPVGPDTPALPDLKSAPLCG